MFRVFAAFAAIVFLAQISFASAGEYGTRDEAVAMVKRVEDMFVSTGADSTFKSLKRWVIISSESEFTANSPLIIRETTPAKGHHADICQRAGVPIYLGPDNSHENFHRCCSSIDLFNRDGSDRGVRLA